MDSAENINTPEFTLGPLLGANELVVYKDIIGYYASSLLDGDGTCFCFL